jgi:diguanylate cyclase (GGDEF)-like protein
LPHLSGRTTIEQHADSERELLGLSPGPYSGLSPALFDRLREQLAESIAVVDGEGRVRWLLGPTGGALGGDDVIGRHIFEYCAPDDLPRAVELAVEALGSSPGWEATWNLPLRDHTGATRDFELHILNCQDDPEIDGFVVRLRELPQRAEGLSRPLFESEFGHELESLAGAMPLPILFVGSDTRLYYLNEAAREMCGATVEALFRDGLGALARGEERSLIEEAVGELLLNAGERTLVFRDEPGPSGESRVIEAQISALGRGTQVLALVATLVDITARYHTESELRRRASSDPLTGLLNRSEIEDCLRLRLERDSGAVGICYVDLDGFKSVNDNHGHEVGDEFLVAVARAITEELGPADRVGRFGGDEFVIVCDLLDAAGLGRFAQRVARSVAKLAGEFSFAVTASVGTGIGQPGDTPRDLLRRADRAMYEEKRTRRVAADLT